MRKLIDTFSKGDYILKVYKSTYKLRGELYHKGSREKISSADFYGKDTQTYRIKEYFGF